MQILGIIPARYASTRFPGKPLANIFGKTMVQHVYERAKTVLNTCVVATDDERIKTAVELFGGNVVMTSPHHQSGTDRCAEALEIFEAKTGNVFDAIINIQGDEPFIAEEQINQLTQILNNSENQIATLIKPIEEKDKLFNPNNVKVVIGAKQQALYFSRQAIPYIRGINEDEWLTEHTFYHHIGMYGYQKQALIEITQLSQGILEVNESLEQLRWLENGFHISTAITNIESIGIDTPEDLENVLKTQS